MVALPAAFARYVDGARQGRTALWRLLLGVALIGLVLALVSAAVVAILVFRFSVESVRGALSTAPGIACVLLTFGGIWAGAWPALRWLHKRPLASVLGAEQRLSWRDFRCAVAAALVCVGVSSVILPWVGLPERSAVALEAWLLWLPLLAALILLQTSAEELLFRGYLMQSLAARFRSPLVWALVPLALFTALHWSAAASWEINAARLAMIAKFAVLAGLMVWFTGNLGAAIGLHFANNLVSLLLISQASELGGAALFVGRPFYARDDWMSGEVALSVLADLATDGLLLLLLLHRRSPLCVRRVASG